MVKIGGCKSMKYDIEGMKKGVEKRWKKAPGKRSKYAGMLK